MRTFRILFRTICGVVFLAAASCTDGTSTDAGMDAAICPSAPVEQGDPCSSEGLRCPSSPVETCPGQVGRPYCTCTSGVYQCEHLSCMDGG